MKFSIEDSRFWRNALAVQGSVTPRVVVRMVIFGVWATLIQCIYMYWPKIAIEIGPLEVSGGVIGVILVLRINAGYDRWWEARKLWGGIVNQTRNLVISALAYGPRNESWREDFARWGASLPYTLRSSLRGEKFVPELHELLGETSAREIEESPHMPSHVALKLAQKLNDARLQSSLDGFAFMQIDKERAQLIDHVGACERIRKTLIPFVYTVKVRRFIVLYLMILPFALTERVGWLTPFVQMFVAYPLLSLDQIGEELRNPFSKRHLSHLPLDEICQAIKQNVLGLLETKHSVYTSQNTKIAGIS